MEHGHIASACAPHLGLFSSRFRACGASKLVSQELGITAWMIDENRRISKIRILALRYPHVQRMCRTEKYDIWRKEHVAKKQWVLF